MKRPVLIIRFGRQTPIVADQRAVLSIVGDLDDTNKYDAMGASHPAGLVTLVMTELSMTEIQDIYSELAEEFETTLPIFATVLDPDAKDQAIDFQTKGIEEMLILFWEKNGFAKAEDVDGVWTLDELLDRVADVGMEGLSIAEKSALDVLSKNNS